MMKPTRNPPRPRYVVTLDALADDSRPGPVRLRVLLKIALRAFRLRCVGLREIHPESAAGANANAET